jgi:hypothetical protein
LDSIVVDWLPSSDSRLAESGLGIRFTSELFEMSASSPKSVSATSKVLEFDGRKDVFRHTDSTPSRGDGEMSLPESFMDAAEAGAFLKLHPKTVMLFARKGKLPGHPIGDGIRKHWLFLRSELDRWVRSKVNSGGHPCS